MTHMSSLTSITLFLWQERQKLIITANHYCGNSNASNFFFHFVWVTWFSPYDKLNELKYSLANM